MPPALALSLGAVAVVLVVVLVLVNRRKERERTEALQRLAETDGLRFEPRGDLGALRALGDVPLFDRGHSKRVANLMKGRLGDRDVAIFDYWFTTGSGKSQHTTSQTVVLLLGANRSLPDLQMAPENPITRLVEKLGYQDIDIDSSPEFSRNYVVKGRDEAAIRSALYPQATSYFADHAGWMVEVRAGNIAIYRGNQRSKADDMRSFIEEAMTAARSLSQTT